VTVYSHDTLEYSDTGEPMVEQEFLHELTVSGMPDHALEFKLDTPLMLLRNLDPAKGLCNGTRLLARQLANNGRQLIVQIMSGSPAHLGALVVLPRIKFIQDGSELGFAWTRVQFPVRCAFAMTINKSQGAPTNPCTEGKGRPTTVHTEPPHTTVGVGGGYRPAVPPGAADRPRLMCHPTADEPRDAQARPCDGWEYTCSSRASRTGSYTWRCRGWETQRTSGCWWAKPTPGRITPTTSCSKRRSQARVCEIRVWQRRSESAIESVEPTESATRQPRGSGSEGAAARRKERQGTRVQH
jgi:hypothetical protein